MQQILHTSQPAGCKLRPSATAACGEVNLHQRRNECFHLAKWSPLLPMTRDTLQVLTLMPVVVVHWRRTRHRKVGQLILEQRWYGLWCALCNLQQALKENKWIDNDGLIIDSHCQFCSKSDGQIFLSDDNLKSHFFLSCHPKFSSRYSWHHQHWLCHLQPVHLQCF